jgi:hypothetical protein
MKSGFKKCKVTLVSKEQQVPYFQTVLATGIKPNTISKK